MQNVDKYPDCPCYNCIVRSTCKIPSMIIMTSVTLNSKHIFQVHLATCKCFLLHKYLEKMDKDDQVGFLLNISEITFIPPLDTIINKFDDRGAE